MQQGLGLQIAAKQQLKISTQLVATMETLAASNEELREKIKKEAESNPVIKVIERTPSYSEFSDRYIASSGKRDDYSDTEPYDPDDSRHNWIEGMVSGGESLEEHLLKQLGEIDTDDRTREAAEIIITALDKNGFLPASPLMILPEKLWDRQEDALAIIQAMDPAGVGASDWRESLILQAKDKGLKGKELKIFSELVLDCLDNLRQGKTAAIAKQLRTDEEEILALSDFLKTLTPFPGREYSSEWDQYITPDISIKKEGDVLRLRINSDALPSVELDPEYTEMLSELLQNKLLKTLEEPYPETVLFLVTNNRESLLPTVRSRCAVLRLTEDERDGEEEQRAEEFAARWHEARFFHEIRALLKDMKNDEEARGLLAVLEREARDRMMQPDLTPEGRLAEAHFIEETERTAENLARKMDFRKALKEFYLRTQRRSKTV